MKKIEDCDLRLEKGQCNISIAQVKKNGFSKMGRIWAKSFILLDSHGVKKIEDYNLRLEEGQYIHE